MSLKLYTKGGDTGSTGLVGGTRVSKSDHRLELYGEVDELNAMIGFGKSFLESSLYHEDILLLERVQNELFNLGSNLACEIDKRETFNLPKVNDDIIKKLEGGIDKCDGACPPLKNFILPGGTKGASCFHVARTVCRRLERRMTCDLDLMPENSLIFINRLSDYFFALSRFINITENSPEKIWQKQ